MNTGKGSVAPEMQVTSIRLESELKQRLRKISGDRGYQTLIRDILWQFVKQQPIPDGEQSRVAKHERLPSSPLLLSISDIRAMVRAVS